MDFPDLSGYRGLIFDMDGTLADSMPVHLKAWQTVAAEHGFTVSRDFIYANGGISSLEVVRLMRDRLGADVGDEKAFAARKLELYRAQIAGIRPFPLVVAQLQHWQARGAKIAVGTGTPRVNALDLVRITGISPDVVVTGEDVQKHKPDPETFLTAARLLGLAPAQCAVFEDGPLGVQAALRGGFACVEVFEGVCVSFRCP